ncbi:probable uridine nucleosidase 2 [Hordeum vulgare subsp. vulgare]|uniref:probable uridine nucleosidase 2 n=1 Tax=Hordeum vulgare subsp. vulgare TaxID=112509 RepID=UPI001D1A58DD|nr:probable uridine nucleosidase 2 [Hordeum vulgare subsp. vulgare]
MAAVTKKKKVIIDTDPRIDDAMAIFVALRSQELEVVGLTTIFGNVYTALATRNVRHLVAGDRWRTDIHVAEGSHVTIKKATKLRIGSFVHGSDGLGNQNFHPPAGKAVEQSAAAFLVEQANLYPGQVTVVALGPLTNLALTVQLDPSFPKKIGQIIILCGAYSVNGNVNPAAQANIFGDPNAADIVFTCGADILAIGINITHQVILSGNSLAVQSCYYTLIPLQEFPSDITIQFGESSFNLQRELVSRDNGGYDGVGMAPKPVDDWWADKLDSGILNRQLLITKAASYCEDESRHGRLTIGVDLQTSWATQTPAPVYNDTGDSSLVPPYNDATNSHDRTIKAAYNDAANSHVRVNQDGL